ncbi:hypothetical protein C4588_03580 [Candidatus Parcubacteria bacterium]|nr:MAG: hypothetical protein C4588_03580 [Candidatus Parcubacteria bacterium]
MPYSNSVKIDYTNWRGERRVREILPMKIMYTKSKYHSEEQWILEAADLEDNYAIKSFAMRDIHSWIPVPLAGEAPVEKPKVISQ